MSNGRFMGMFAGNQSNVESGVQNIMPAAGTVESFYVFIQTAPGAGASWTLTLRKNGADTAVTCTISGAIATTCFDTTNTAIFAAGDLISVKETAAGGPTAAPGQWTAQFRP